MEMRKGQDEGDDSDEMSFSICSRTCGRIRPSAGDVGSGDIRNGTRISVGE